MTWNPRVSRLALPTRKSFVPFDPGISLERREGYQRVGSGWKVTTHDRQVLLLEVLSSDSWDTVT
jgi:hypothetical protein